MAHVQRRRRYGCWITSVIVLTCLAGLVGWWNYTPPYHPPPKVFDGDSSDLRQTAIVPTLDTPIPEGKSAVWCVSFQLAWNHFKSEIAKDAIRIEDAEVIADRLNRAEQSDLDLAPESYYAAAGLTKDGILEKIRRDMSAKFPSAPLSSITYGTTAAVAFAYLSAETTYTHPYLENTDKFVFNDAKGEATVVNSFGIREKDHDTLHEMREQLEVLYCQPPYGNQREPLDEFALDLCHHSAPNQIVLARMKRRNTLAETLADLQSRIAKSPPQSYMKHFSPTDSVLIPSMHWRVAHHYIELEGSDHPFQNEALHGLYFAPALQVIEFRMDRYGAATSSFALLGAASGPRPFHFDRPFLIYMQKSDAKYPFFVMWVDNAELLCN